MLTPEARATRDRVIDLVVAEEYDRRISRGEIDKGKLRDLIRGDVVTQAREHPGWLRQQGDRLLGAQQRPGSHQECPWCDIAFSPRDAETTRGSDGLLYCRRSCADHELFIATLDDYLAEHPEAVHAESFLRLYLSATRGQDRVPQKLEPIGAGTFDDLDDDIPIAPAA